MAAKIFKPFIEQGILQKLVVAIMLMVVIPLLLLIYLLYTEAATLLMKDSAQLIILLMVGSACCGYILSRKMIISILKITKEAETIARGNLTKRIETPEKNEINTLAQYFNQITNELEENIEQLKESKRIMQNVLLRIGSALASSEKIESILELTIETLTSALNASSGAIMLLEKDKLRTMISYGIDSRGAKSISTKLGEGVIGWVAQEKQAQNITRTQHDHRFDVEVKLGLAHQSIICAPLIYQDTVLGTISVHDKSVEEGFSEDDLFLLKNLAAQTAIALENQRLNQDIERTYLETISALALAVEAKDPYSRGHAKRVNEYVSKLAEHFHLDQESLRTLQDAAVLHDIGKIGIKDEILLKPTALIAEEKRLMHRHAIIGENILKPIRSLEKVAYLVRHHQEQQDGKGYPDGLSGKEMSLSLKILIAADAFDAMTTDRPYRRAMSLKEAKKELQKYSGIYFDQQVVETLIKIF
ncbi:MAG: GAF domain-containing protein [Candidatus Omnitrophica bacterium]|nr:GAF domain-containing protein [Candidatus Omnitrophota bacterium]